MSEKGWWEAEDSPEEEARQVADLAKGYSSESSLIFPPDSFEGYSSTEDEGGMGTTGLFGLRILGIIIFVVLNWIFNW